MTTNIPKDYFTTNIANDFFHLFCGDMISSGSSRQTFEYALDPTKVVKIELAQRSFQNVIEWETWTDLKGSSQGKFLAPCHQISPCGIILIMERTAKPPKNYKWPTSLPSFLTDFKYQNYGLLKNRLVCHDYGTNTAVHNLRDSLKKTKPKWWDENDK